MKYRLKKYIRFLVKNKIHFIAWFFFIFYEIVLAGILRGYFASPGNYFVFYVFNISLFYFHAHFILPRARKNSKHTIWLLPLLILIEVVVYVPLTIGIVAILQKYTSLDVFTSAAFDKTSLGNGVWRTIYFILFSSGYYYLMNYLKERKAFQQSENEKLMMIIENQHVQSELIKSQHAHLKAQINPHFLFNTLSFIYSNTRKVVPEAAEAIMALSEMMRYALQDDSEHTFIPLKLEIEQVKNLIRLHQLKAENNLNINFKCDDNIKDIQIIPLILMTLIENMFKHGNLLRADSPALISIYSDGQTLVIETENLIDTQNTRTSHHIGLDNSKKRLDMVYGHKAMLNFGIGKDNYFNVSLRIELN
ncbi:sensor histidine kinase [Pedobacter nyackensis]|uniref:sensor histidine kinase n=1 Tax=Pedobacter nyackensis TaxID=475255 RepID=UPI0029301F1F|nr:histidine kinase [Pedobacter nyackensis]